MSGHLGIKTGIPMKGVRIPVGCDHQVLKNQLSHHVRKESTGVEWAFRFYFAPYTSKLPDTCSVLTLLFQVLGTRFL